MATKRTLIIIAFFLLSSLPMLAQQIWWIDTTATGTEKKVFLGNFNVGYNSGGLNIGRLPVQSVNSPVSGTTATTVGGTAVVTGTTQVITLGLTSNYIDISNVSALAMLICVDTGYGTNTLYLAPYAGYRWAVATTAFSCKLASTGTGTIYYIAQ